jgi:hypothetical protein
LNSQIVSTTNSLIDLTDKVKNLVNPLINLLNSLVGQNSFFSLVNCKFIGADVNNLLSVFGGKYSDASKGLGIMLILISFMNAVMIVFTIFALNFSAPAASPSEQQPQNLEMGRN